MKTSKKGLDLIKSFEGLKLNAYLCPARAWTIGYGHTGYDVYQGQVITESEADEILLKDVQEFERKLNSLNLNLNQNQFDALIDFIFNLGFGSLLRSTLLKDIQAGDFDLAALEFLRWNRSEGYVLDGLTRRRKAESNLFKGGDYE